MEEKTIGERAAEKIALQISEAKDKLKGEMGGGIAAARRAMKLVLIQEIGNMISRFCYQNEEFASAVEKCEKTLLEIVEEVTKDVDQNNPSLSDVVAYTVLPMKKGSIIMFFLRGYPKRSTKSNLTKHSASSSTVYIPRRLPK